MDRCEQLKSLSNDAVLMISKRKIGSRFKIQKNLLDRSFLHILDDLKNACLV